MKANDYYTEEAEAPKAEAKPQESKTALIPKSLIGSAKEDDTISFVVGRTFEDEVEVVPKSEKEEEAEEGQEKPDMPMREMDQTLSGLTA